MKPALLLFKKGQRVWALVEEAMADNELLVNFSGDLIRVSNSSSRILRVGERVQLEVETLSPLTLRLVPLLKRRDPVFHLDRTV